MIESSKHLLNTASKLSYVLLCGSIENFLLLFYAVDHPCILAAVSNIQFGSIACTEYSNHYSISVSHYNSFSIYRNSFSTHSNIFDDRESELYVSFISKRSNVSVWERVTILYISPTTIRR